jgi:hypothetical protein
MLEYKYNFLVIEPKISTSQTPDTKPVQSSSYPHSVILKNTFLGELLQQQFMVCSKYRENS